MSCAVLSYDSGSSLKGKVIIIIIGITTKYNWHGSTDCYRNRSLVEDNRCVGDKWCASYDHSYANQFCHIYRRKKVAGLWYEPSTFLFSARRIF